MNSCISLIVEIFYSPHDPCTMLVDALLTEKRSLPRLKNVSHAYSCLKDPLNGHFLKHTKGIRKNPFRHGVTKEGCLTSSAENPT